MAQLSVFLSVVAMALGLTLAVTNDERDAINQAIGPIMAKYTEEFGITKEALLAAQKAGGLESLDPCLHACFFKKINFINEDGLFNTEGALAMSKTLLKGEEDQKTVAAIIKTCSAVNEETVSDGVKGCDRSKILLSCIIKNNGSVFFPFAA